MVRLFNEFVQDAVNANDKDEYRFSWIFLILIVISAITSVVDYLTGYVVLFWVTLCFALLCSLDYILCKISPRGVKLASWLFGIELISVLTFFIYSGIPSGVSAIWACIVPACSLFLYKRRFAVTITAIMFLISIFFLCTPWGYGLLKYHYSMAFRIRFPLIYICFFLISFLLETIRQGMYKELKRAKLEYERLYYYDDLTGTLNRRGFNELVEKTLTESGDKRVTLVILDIDHFKRINDTYGHLKGDVVLKELADILKKNCKAPISRWGGEEFAILCTDDSLNEKNINKLLRLVETRIFDRGDKKIRLTISIGVAYADGNVDPMVLFRHADRCLYEAKNKGRNMAKFCYINKEIKK